MEDLPRSLAWRDGRLNLLDQRKLPQEEILVTCSTVEMVFEAISTLTVRGAPAIGIAAAYGLLIGLEDESESGFEDVFESRCDYLISARPTAVNLAWAVNRMRQKFHDRAPGSDPYKTLLEEAMSIHSEDAAMSHAIGDAGLPLVEKYPRLLTHCNAGSLAVAELGTALAPIYKAHQKGISVHVFVDETRPLLQGARLTAWELDRSGIDCTLITDNMAAHFMSRGEVDMVIVGADRIAANGDAANKIGTLNLAILCKHFAIPFYVAVPDSTIDTGTLSGSQIVIEERAEEEVKYFAGQQIAPSTVKARSPAFDVTPAELITGIITNKGVIGAPYEKSIAAMMESAHG